MRSDEVIDEVVELVLQRVMERLAKLSVSAPAYAVGLANSPGNVSLDVEMLAVAIEHDRTKWDGELDPAEAVFQSWNPNEFSVQEAIRPPSPAPDDETFAAAEAKAEAELLGRSVGDPQRFVHNRVAARLDPSRLSFPVTDDFIAFAFDGPDHTVTAENIRFSASPRALAILERKNLLM